MTRKRERRRQDQSTRDRARVRPGPRLPSELERKFADTGLELARRALKARKWRSAYDYAEKCRAADEAGARALMAEASSRQARRTALYGNFAEARWFAERAVELRPKNRNFQERLRSIRLAADAVLSAYRDPLFPATFGPTAGPWWRQDLLGRIRGGIDGTASVPSPLLLSETRRPVLADVYALGIYQPWHVGGPTPLFTRYIKLLKPAGQTIPYAALLLRQGLTEETDWIEDIDAVVPMATSLKSFERRGFEFTEELASELAFRLCLPLVDVFETDPEAEPTHTASGYRARAKRVETLRLKTTRSETLSSAEAVLVVDDVVTSGATFEACARRLTEVFGVARVYGAALAYTETPHRRERAEEERDET
jgi:predicted amidophosphoribosyltransferase